MRIGEAAGGGEGEGRVRMGRDRRGKEGGRRWRETEVEGEGENNHHMSSASHEVATLMQHTHHCTPHTLSTHTSVLQSKAR